MIIAVDNIPYRAFPSTKVITPGRNYSVEQRTLVAAWGAFIKDSACVRVCDFIARRTLTFGHEEEYIPERHFLEGVRNRTTGQTYTDGLAISRSTLKRALTKLDAMRDDKGRCPIIRVLKRFRNSGHHVYCYRLNAKFNAAAMLKIPRPKKQPTPEDAFYEKQWEDQVEQTNNNRRVQILSARRVKPDTYKQEQTLNNLNKNCAQSAVPRAVLKIPKRKESVPCEKKEVDLVPPPNIFQRVKAKPVPVVRELNEFDQAKKLWLELEKEAVTDTETGKQFSPVKVWGGKEKGQMQTLLKKWKVGGGEFTDFLELITHTITNWAKITKLLKNSPPSQPSLGFFVTLFDFFRNAAKKLELVKAQAADYQEVVKAKMEAQRMKHYERTGHINRSDERVLEKDKWSLRRDGPAPEHSAKARQQRARQELADRFRNGEIGSLKEEFLS